MHPFLLAPQAHHGSSDNPRGRQADRAVEISKLDDALRASSRYNFHAPRLKKSFGECTLAWAIPYDSPSWAMLRVPVTISIGDTASIVAPPSIASKYLVWAKVREKDLKSGIYDQ